MGTCRFFAELFFNRFVTHIPFSPLKSSYLRMLGAQIGVNVFFYSGTEVLEARRLVIGSNCHIGRYCQIDARGGISIDDNVCVASHVLIITADHNIHSTHFEGRLAPVHIGERCWLCSRSVILKGVSIGVGSVVAAGSVVTKNVNEYSICSGVPAVRIGSRSSKQTYELSVGPTWY